MNVLRLADAHEAERIEWQLGRSRRRNLNQNVAKAVRYGSMAALLGTVLAFDTLYAFLQSTLGIDSLGDQSTVWVVLLAIVAGVLLWPRIQKLSIGPVAIERLSISTGARGTLDMPLADYIGADRFIQRGIRTIKPAPAKPISDTSQAPASASLQAQRTESTTSGVMDGTEPASSVNPGDRQVKTGVGDARLGGR